jgi:hypothetical protein
MEIDWNKEASDKNLCGYCTGPHISTCNGSCFTHKDHDQAVVDARRLEHAKDREKQLLAQIDTATALRTSMLNYIAEHDKQG